jgi:hypothetical protein
VEKGFPRHYKQLFRYTFSAPVIVYSRLVMRCGENDMSLNKEYASFLIAASNIYGAQSSTKCSKAESQFEKGLFKLFAQASNGGLDLQDIVVITSVAIAAILTRAETIQSTKSRQTALDDPAGALESNVVALRSRSRRAAQ